MKKKTKKSRLVKKQHPAHSDQLVALRRIEGQVRGIQGMIDSRRYCIDILTQLHSILGAITRVQDKILQKHLSSCVKSALKGKSVQDKDKKINEITVLLKRFRKVG